MLSSKLRHCFCPESIAQRTKVVSFSRSSNLINRLRMVIPRSHKWALKFGIKRRNSKESRNPMPCFDCKKQQNIETKQLNTETKRQNANFFLPVYVKCRDTLKNFGAVLYRTIRFFCVHRPTSRDKRLSTYSFCNRSSFANQIVITLILFRLSLVGYPMKSRRV